MMDMQNIWADYHVTATVDHFAQRYFQFIATQREWDRQLHPSLFLFDVQMIIPDVRKLHAGYITQALASDNRKKHRVLHIILRCLGCFENYPPLVNIKTFTLYPVNRFSGGHGWVVSWLHFTGMLSFFINIDQNHANNLRHAALPSILVLFDYRGNVFCSNRL